MIAWRPTMVLSVVALVLVGAAAGWAQEAPAGEVDPALLEAGQAVFEANCVACHQEDGRGIPGAFPPLVDNERVQGDAAYVAQTVRNGLQGELVVDGVTYNGAMPAFSLLDDGQIDAVVAYVQAGLGQAAAEPPAAAGGGGEVAGTELPFATVVTYTVGFLAFLVVAAFVAAPYVMARSERHEFDRIRAWLKAGVIFVFFVVATVVVPSFLMEWGPVTRAPRIVQDLIGSGVWVVALLFGLWALRRGQKERML